VALVIGSYTLAVPVLALLKPRVRANFESASSEVASSIYSFIQPEDASTPLPVDLGLALKEIS
jgi:hypothetical protein